MKNCLRRRPIIRLICEKITFDGKIERTKIVPFGPAAMIGYLYAKEIESKNLRIILIGKINKVPEEILRSRVRDTYE